MQIRRLMVCIIAIISGCVNDAVIPTNPLFTRARTPLSGDPCESVGNWALDRIDQSAKHLNETYCYWPSAGAGIPIYILDSGIHCSHTDLVGRCGSGVDFVGDGHGTDDCFGHGTQMAGIAGGMVWGVAKLATLVPVRIIDCTGLFTDANVQAGLDWIATNHTPPGVINISLDGDSTNASGDSTRIANLVAAGFTVVIAAGNGHYDACSRIAGKFPTAIRVGASASGGNFYGPSNYGPCVDLFAPGDGIVSDWFTSDVATFIAFGGTSQSAAFVSGAAALYLAGHPSASPSLVKTFIVSSATVGALLGVPLGTVNLLLRTHNGTP